MDATLPLLSIAPLVPIASDASQRVCALMHVCVR